jgi:hypothetical protein
MDTFLYIYDNPPSGTIRDGRTNTTTPVPLTHALEAEFIPNILVDEPQLAEDLVGWGRSYLKQNAQHEAPSLLTSIHRDFSSYLRLSPAGSEATVCLLYGSVIHHLACQFAEAADQLQPQSILFQQCGARDEMDSAWKWTRHDETRMVVESKGRKVFNRYCNAIRALATANKGSGSVLALAEIDNAQGARSIVIKVSSAPIFHTPIYAQQP